MIDTVNDMKLSKNCIVNWWINFRGKDKNVTTDEARYKIIHDYEVELKLVVVRLYIKRATIFTPAQKEQLLEYVKKTSNDELTKALAVEDLTKLWCISTTRSTAPRITTPNNGTDHTPSTPKRSNKKSDRSVLVQDVSPVDLLKKNDDNTTQISDLTEGTTHFSDGSTMDEVDNGQYSREQVTRTFEEQLVDESANDTTQTNFEPKQGVLLSTSNRHFRLGL